MSRIGKAIINIPAGVKVAVNGQNIKVLSASSRPTFMN